MVRVPGARGAGVVQEGVILRVGSWSFSCRGYCIRIGSKCGENYGVVRFWISPLPPHSSLPKLNRNPWHIEGEGMPTSSRRGHISPELPTATAIADPVLLYAKRGPERTVLLAEDMDYSQAGIMRLQTVRWSRRGRGFLRAMREPANLSVSEARVRNVGLRHFTSIPGTSSIMAGAAIEHLHTRNLSAELYRTLLAASPRELHQYAQQLCEPRRRSLLSPTLTVARTFTRVVNPLRAAINAQVSIMR